MSFERSSEHRFPRSGASQGALSRVAGTGPAMPELALAEPALATVAPVIGVVGARGGVGASVLSAAVGRMARRAGDRVVVVDGTPCGGGTDVLLGIEDDPGLRWPDLHAARGEVGGDQLLALLPTWQGVSILSADRRRPAPLPRDVHEDVVRGLAAAGDVVVLDLAAGDAARWAALCTVLVVVARCDLTSVAGAVATVGAAPGIPAGLVARGPAAGRLTAWDVARAVGIDLWADIRSDPTLAGRLERGEGPLVRVGRGRSGDLGRAASTVLGASRRPRATGGAGAWAGPSVSTAPAPVVPRRRSAS